MGTSSNTNEGVSSFESCQMNDIKYSKMRLESIISSLREERLISLFVEPTSHCDLACQFCAMHSTVVDLDDSSEGKFARKSKSRMSYEDFSILMEMLLSIPKLKMLQFSGHGEPLLNKSLPKMIALAKEKGVTERIVVTTNGTLLNETKFRNLIDAGVDEIRVSLDCITPEIYEKVKGADKAEILKDNLLNCLNIMNSINTNATLIIECIRLNEPGMAGALSEEEAINRIFGDKVRMTAGATFRWRDERNWVGQMGHGQPFLRNKPCEFPFFALFVHSDCRVSSCCADTTQSFVIGDFREAEDFRYFINSPALKELRYSLVNLDFNPICKRCDFSSAVDDELLASRDLIVRLLGGEGGI
ncbi:MAG: hypothetical protein QG599_2464 [Pseudomonadota bacterium]|nr:hypothetical protein [Pseudomonadota bacterium]